MPELKCQICNSEMKLVDEKKIGLTKYKILKCDKCKHTVARSSI